MSNRSRHSIGIIGGGISGLTTGFLLRNQGFDITIYEKSASPGGVIKSVKQDEWLIELGPNTIMAKSEQLWNLIKKLNLETEIVETGDEAKKRYVIKNGRPLPLPASLSQFFSTGLISAKAKLRLFKEPFISKGNTEETVSDFFERRLGKEVVDYAVNPFIAGIYAGDPKELIMRHTFSSLYELEQEYGSLARGAIKSVNKKKNKPAKKGLISFRKGVQQLPEALALQLRSNMKFTSSISGVFNYETGWQLKTKEQEQPFHHDVVIFTAPLHTIPSIQVQINRSELFKRLADLRYAPIVTAAVGFNRNQVEHPLDGFGVLVPEVEPFDILGCLFSSSLFEGRAPQDRVLLTCFAGGERSPGMVDESEEAIEALVLQNLESLLGCSGNPLFVNIHKWENAIPQFNKDYQSYLDTMEELEHSNPGFYMTGNFRGEVSVPGCIRSAHETAERVATFLES